MNDRTRIHLDRHQIENKRGEENGPAGKPSSATANAKAEKGKKRRSIIQSCVCVDPKLDVVAPAFSDCRRREL